MHENEEFICSFCKLKWKTCNHQIIECVALNNEKITFNKLDLI